MATLYVRHKVADYSKWKSAYDELGATRKKWGVTGASVSRDASDANTLIVLHHFDDLASAQKFANPDVLKNAMANAGVVGHPEIWMGEEIEQTPF
jgi:hypothetical protein